MEPTCAEDETTTSCEEATAEFCGSLVRLDCGNEGVYQGIVLEVDPTNAHIQIERPFRNGVSLDNQVIQIPGELIKEVLVVHTLPNAISTSTKNSYATSTSTKNLLPNSTKSKQTTTSPKLKSRDQPTKKEQPINKREQPLIKREQTINKREQPINKREQSTNKREQPINKREQPTTKREQPTKTNEQPTCKRDISKKKREPLVDQTQQKTDKLRIKTLKQTTNHRKLKSKEQQTNKRNSAIKKDEAQLVEEIQQKTDKMSIKEKEEPPQGVSEETASPISNEEGKTRFIGCLASVYLTNTPDIYQGKILSVDAEEHSVRLEKPILNGRPLSIPFIDISGKMMKDIRVVRGPSPVRSHENRPSSAVNKAEENFESFMLQATCIQHEDGRRQQQLPDNRTPPSDISESAADCESNHLAPSNYNSSDTLSGDEEFHSDESSDEYNGPRTFDQRHNKQQLPTLNQRNEVENLEEMKVATPSSAYVIHYCASPVEAKEQSASNTDKTPRQRRITCAERMLMINQRQQTNDGSSVRSGTPTYANRNRPVTPLTPRSSSVQSNAQIYMQSSCKVGRGMTASIPTGNNESRFGNSRSNSFNNQNPCKTANVPGSVRIMQKLFSPTKSEQREFNMAPSQHQCVTGQRIDVNDLLREPPAMSRPGSSAGSLNREAFTSMKSPLRRPLSAVVLAPMNAGAANFRVLHNRSPIIATGRHSMGSMPSHRRPSPADSVRSEHFKRFSPPNASSPPATVTRAQFAHQAFGEFKLFKGQQQAIPMRLQVNYRRNIHGEYGPTGIPAVDCSNGYRSYSDRYAEAIMGDPLDPNLETDFDFAGNLALFDKAEFNRETEHIFQGLDSACDSSRNYRNDENVLQDSSRVISWTKSTAVADDDDNQNTSTSSPVD